MKLKWKQKRKNYMSKQQKVFKPFDRSWIEIGALYSNWSKCTCSFIKDMRCCGFCGFTKLHLQKTHFNVVPNTFGIVVGATLYGCSNIIMSTYTTTGDSLHVYVCNACFKLYEQPKRIKYILFQSMDYLKQILANNPLDLQLLSLIDILMKIEQRNYGFMHGQIQPSGLLDNPLLCWNSKFQPTSTSKDVNLAFKDLLHQNLFSNPLIQKYITNIEKPNPTHGLCVLSSLIVKKILA